MTEQAFPLLVVTAWGGLLSVFVTAAILWTIGICYWQQQARRLILTLTLLLYARYMVWRLMYTINTDDWGTLVLGWTVYGAEVYAFIQVLLFVTYGIHWSDSSCRSPNTQPSMFS